MLSETMQSTRDRLERSARDLLYGTALFFPVRSCYQLVFKRQLYALDRQMRDFYAPFVHPGDLVFDVGGNVGHYAEVFSGLGARVVSVEPNPECCRKLRRLARVRQVQVEQCAIGDVSGRATLRICEASGLSTLSERWYENAQRSPVLRAAKWLETIEVEVKTLDQLATRHGIPNFVKIDVEGYDDQVLRGMSFLPAAISFEFTQRAPEVAMRCLDTLAGRYRFNYVRGMEMQLAWDSWTLAEEARERLEFISEREGEEYGDIVARRIE